MSEDDDSLPPAEPVDPAKKQTFLMIMHTAIAASCAGDPDGATLKMSLAIDTSERIPADLSASEAATEYTHHLFDSGRNEEPPKWTGLMSQAEFEATRWQHPIEILVGDEWHVEDPRWLGLPGDSIHHLNMLAHIRENGTATFGELLGILPGIDPKELAKLLADAEEEGSLHRHSTPAGPGWKASSTLIGSRPSSLMVAHAEAHNRYALSHGKDHLEALSALDARRQNRHNSFNRDAKVILSTLQSWGRARTVELAKQLSHLDRYSVRRLLDRLSDAGIVENISEGKNAVWRIAVKGSVAPLNGSREAPPRPEARASEGRKPKPVLTPRAPFELISTEELDRVARYVLENPGCKIAEISERLQFESLNRVRNITEKLYGGRRLYRRVGRHYPGKDPDWE